MNMAGALMNSLFNGDMKPKKANAAVRIGHYGMRAIEGRDGE